jgi:tetratricopeptide (TPR) repeat protein
VAFLRGGHEIDLGDVLASIFHSLRMSAKDILDSGSDFLCHAGDVAKMLSTADDAAQLVNDLDMRAETGYLLAFFGRYERAMRHVEYILHREPNNELALLTRAELMEKPPFCDPVLALKDLDKLINLRPDHHRYYLNRAHVLERQREFERAIADLEQARKCGADRRMVGGEIARLKREEDLALIG